jgi:lipopolysaccharide assembly outer membrane protein LptD (OstA)
MIFRRLILFLFMAFPLLAQDAAAPFPEMIFSPELKQGIPDTSVTDSSMEKSTTEQLSSPIYYWAEQVSVSRRSNRIYLSGKAKLRYENMNLEAERIMVDQDNRNLFAEGVVDTVDSLGNPIYTGTPVFAEKGEDPIYGTSLSYDFETRRGKINVGKTKMPPGYYRGDRINKISDNTLLVCDGYFTSCEYIDDPHFYFRSDQMRVQVKDKIIARPVYFYIADVPLFAIPFGVFPNKRGRTSGIVVPSYGESSFGGRFLKNIGYYWAPNDYLDATFLTDYYELLGFNFKTNLTYTVRYLLNGSVNGYFYPRDPNSGARRERWAVNFNHSQIIDPTMRISASGKFQSDKNLEKQYSSNIDQRLNQVITSNLTLSKRWKGTKNSLSANVSRTENLQTGDISYTLPSLRFSRSQSTIYETITGESPRGQREWYQEVYFSYNSQGLYKGSKTLQSDSSFLRTTSQGVQHDLSFNAPQKVLKYFSLNPSVSYQEIWVDEITTGSINPETNRVEYEQKKQFAARRTFNSSLSLKTTLFGLFEPNIGSLKFIRHKMDPQVSFTYTPDFSDPGYGYFQQITDTTGKEVKVDKFQKNPFSRTPTNESRFLRLSLGNLFQAKLTEDGEEKKIDLFTVNFSTGYNFKADSLRWQDLSTTLQATPFSGTNLSLSARHSFYAAGPTGSGKVERFLPDEGFLPRLVSLSAGFSFSLSDKTFNEESDKNKKPGQPDEEPTEDDGILSAGGLQQDLLDDENAAKNLDIPWRVNFNVNYSLDRNNIFNKNERLDLSTTASVSLTKNWRINWSGRFDLIDKDITYQSFSIYRDLHCWEMSFNWQPSFNYYSLQINVKTSMLRDIKVTKRPAGRAYY